MNWQRSAQNVRHLRLAATLCTHSYAISMMATVCAVFCALCHDVSFFFLYFFFFGATSFAFKQWLSAWHNVHFLMTKFIEINLLADFICGDKLEWINHYGIVSGFFLSHSSNGKTAGMSTMSWNGRLSRITHSKGCLFAQVWHVQDEIELFSQKNSTVSRPSSTDHSCLQTV